MGCSLVRLASFSEFFPKALPTQADDALGLVCSVSLFITSFSKGRP
jgi:hypothetical protein